MKKNSNLYRGRIFRWGKNDSLKSKIQSIPFHIKCFFQRGRNGYARCDVWDMDVWFKETISHMLNDFIETVSSYPDRDEANSFESWLSILKEMKACFEETKNEDCRPKLYDSIYDIDNLIESVKSEDGSKTVIFKHDPRLDSLLEIEKNWMTESYQKEHRGLNLFVKWFDDLWD